MAQIRHSSQIKDDDSVMPVLSFSPHTYSMVTDGKITSSRVVDYQKRYTPEKYYVYLINICREDQSKPTFVFRRYSHFHEFNAKLADQFPRRILPKLPSKSFCFDLRHKDTITHHTKPYHTIQPTPNHHSIRTILFYPKSLLFFFRQNLSRSIPDQNGR